MKNKLREYGVLGTVVYFTISFSSLTSFYYAIKNKILDPDKFIDNLENSFLSKYIALDKIRNLTTKDGAYFTIALILNKAFIVLRLPLTLILVYLITKFK